MAEQIGQAGSVLNLRLGQNPSIQNPRYTTEFQLIYNALHLLGQYMDVLRRNLESAPGQTPSESVRFRKTYWAEALQPITLGSVVSGFAGGIINGVASSDVKYSPSFQIEEQVGGTGNRRTWGIEAQMFGIALTDAAIGEMVQVGIGPGITQVTGSKCGQLIWGVDSRSVNSQRAANTAGNYFTGRTPVGNGGVYLNNIITQWYTTGGYVNHEGYNAPGYPFNSGGNYYSSNIYLYPIGVCVFDGFVLFKDYVRSDSLPFLVITS
jgi:hypothetical protein